MTTGEADSLECLLRRIGVDATEFTNPEGPGRINLFSDPCVEGDCNAADHVLRERRRQHPERLRRALEQCRQPPQVRHRVHVLHRQPSRRAATRRPRTSRRSRITSTRAAAPSSSTTTTRGSAAAPKRWRSSTCASTFRRPFPSSRPGHCPTASTSMSARRRAVDYTIDTAFPKGNSFADWLVNVGATTTRGTISLLDVKHPALAVDPAVAQRWIYRETTAVAGVSAVPFFTVNTPIEQAATPENAVRPLRSHRASTSRSPQATKRTSRSTPAAPTPRSRLRKRRWNS